MLKEKELNIIFHLIKVTRMNVKYFTIRIDNFMDYFPLTTSIEKAGLTTILHEPCHIKTEDIQE